MNCARTRKWFSEAREGRLPEKRQRLFEAHVSDCPECAAAWERWTAALAMFRAIGEPCARPGFHDAIMGQVRSLPSPAPSRPTPYVPRPTRPWLRPALATAVTGVLAVAVYFAVRPEVTTRVPSGVTGLAPPAPAEGIAPAVSAEKPAIEPGTAEAPPVPAPPSAWPGFLARAEGARREPMIASQPSPPPAGPSAVAAAPSLAEPGEMAAERGAMSASAAAPRPRSEEAGEPRIPGSTAAEMERAESARAGTLPLPGGGPSAAAPAPLESPRPSEPIREREAGTVGVRRTDTLGAAVVPAAGWEAFALANQSPVPQRAFARSGETGIRGSEFGIRDSRFSSRPAEPEAEVRRVSLQLEGVRMERAIDAVAQQGNVRVTVEGPVQGTVSANFYGDTPQEALDRLARLADMRVVAEGPDEFRVEPRGP